jgi:glycerol-3-phosphate dehydrogenase
VETWEACRTLVDSAAELGAETLTYHQVTGLLVEGGKVCGATATNQLTGEEVRIDCDLVVNAAGAWGGTIGRMAGCDVTVYAGKGTMVAMNYRLVNTVLNRCGPTSDGDILVPIGSVAVMGTTSVRVPDPDNYPIEDWEVEKMLDEGEKMIPSFKQFRPLRAWAGVRPLYQETAAGADLRKVTRKYFLLDHTQRDGVDGLVTITGGKWTTYRQMAEHTVDLICQKLGTQRPCQTATTVLKGHDEPKYWSLGQRLSQLESQVEPGQLICECELVTRGQIEATLAHQETKNIINNLRRDLRVGMGPCQGGFCTYRVAGIMHHHQKLSACEANKALADFLQERWKGSHRSCGTPCSSAHEGICLGLLGLDNSLCLGADQPGWESKPRAILSVGEDCEL